MPASRTRGRRGLVALLFCVLLVPLPVLSSVEEDEGVLVRVLQDLLSDAGREVRIFGFDGALSSRATVREITIADDQGTWVALEGVVIDWNRASLLNRRIEINELSAEHIDLRRLPSLGAADGPQLAASEEFRLPELPVSIDIAALAAQSVTLDPAITGESVALTLQGNVHLAAGQGETVFDAHRTDDREGRFLFAGSFDNTTRILSLDLRAHEGAGGVAATLLGIPERPALGMSVKGVGPVATYGAEIALSVNDAPAVTGEFGLLDTTPETGVLQGGGFTLDLTGDLRPLLVRELHPFFGAQSRLSARGQRSEDGAIELSNMVVETEASHLEGRVLLAASGLPQLVQVTAGIARPDGEPVLLPATGGAVFLSGATLSIRHDVTASRDWSMRAQINGLRTPSLEIAETTLDARGRLNSLSPTQATGSTSSEPTFEGVFEFLAQGLASQDPAVQRATGPEVFGLASMVWPGAGAPLELTGLAIEGDTLSLTAYGVVDGLTFDGFSEFSAPDLAAFSGLAGRPLAGQALVTTRGQVNGLTGAFDQEIDLRTESLSIGQPQADALLAGSTAIALSARRDTEGTQIRGLSLVAGPAELTLTGTLQPGFSDLSARLQVADLSALGPGYGGRIAVDALYSGDPDTRRLRVDGSVVDLRGADLPGGGMIERMMTGAHRLRADLRQTDDVTQIALFTIDGPRLRLEAEGAWSPNAPEMRIRLHELALAALLDGGQGSVTGSAALQGDRATVQLDGAGPIGAASPSIQQLLAGRLAIRAEAGLPAGGAIDLQSFQIETGAMTATAQGVFDPQGAVQLAARADLPRLGAVVPGMAGAAALTAQVQRATGAAAYSVNGTLSGPSSLLLRVSGAVQPSLDLDLAVEAQLDAALINSFIEPSTVQGMIRATGSVVGPPRIESLRLHAQTSGARFVQPNSAVAFRDIVASADLVGLRSRVVVDGESLSGGEGHLSGSIDLAGDRQANLIVRARDLGVSVPRLFDTRITGEIALVGPLRLGPRASGTVSVNPAEIRIPNSPLGRQGFVPQGLRHVGADGPAVRTRENAGISRGTTHGRNPVPIALDITLNAPGRIFVRGRGLDAELGGTLVLRGTTHDVVAQGSFGLIRGRLDLLGNRFTLTDGSASMIGGFLPYINLTATTESDGVLTSVTIAGEADRPEITFSSVPELPQDEVLARLVFRRSLASLSPFQAAQLALSVATLTGRAEGSVLTRTREAMGLDDLDFTIDEVGNTALRAGRYVNDRVYTDLSVDSTGRGEVSINLDLNSNLTVRGRADTAGGSGLGIFFERDY